MIMTARTTRNATNDTQRHLRSMKERITKDTTIEEILEQHPETVKVFMDFGVPYLVCGEPLWGKVEEVAKKYKADLTELLEKLNGVTGS